MPSTPDTNLPTRKPRTEVHIVLDRLRSAHNTGNIFRLADAVGAVEIVACGYTPAPPHPKLAKTAMGADETVPCRVFPDAETAVRALRSEGVGQILAVETSDDGIPPWEMDYESPLALIFGNEALGVSKEALDICDGVVSLPMLGHKESINVGNCAAVVLYSLFERKRAQESKA